MNIDERLDGVTWDRIEAELDRKGWATTGPLLGEDERRALIAAYDDDALFRSTVVMARHGYGRGEYRYFAYPLPKIVQTLRERLYGQLLPITNRWRAQLGSGDPFPQSYAEFLDASHAAGQA